MKLIKYSILIAAAAALSTGVASAQQWEFGGVGGGGFLNTVPASGSVGSATAGFAPGFATGGFFGENFNQHLSGELRYEYLQSDLQLSSAGQTAKFTGASQAIHFDVVYHTSRRESRVQFFGVVGGGGKVFSGTGAEEAFQALSQFGYFTKTQTFKPFVAAGGGFTYRLSDHLFLRSEVRDFISAFPAAVLTPAPGVKYGSILQQVVPTVGIVYMK